MPLWTNVGAITALTRSVPFTLLDEEVVVDTNTSIAVAVPPRSGQFQSLTFTIAFGGVVTSVDYQLQVALLNVDAEFYDVGPSMTDIDGGKITVNDLNVNFARIIANDADVQEVTALIQSN